MKANTWKTILQIAISILTAIATTLGVTSCMDKTQTTAHLNTRRAVVFVLPRIPVMKGQSH